MLSAIDTSRCCAPSCRSRSSRRRSSSPIWSMRSRELRSSSSFARSAASSRSFSSASAGRGAHRLHVLAHAGQPGVVHERGDALAVAVDYVTTRLGSSSGGIVFVSLQHPRSGPARAARTAARARDRRPRRPRPRAGCPARGASPSLVISSPTAPPCAIRVRTNAATNRYGTSASGMTEMMKATSSAPSLRAARLQASCAITAIISATPAAYTGA